MTTQFRDDLENEKIKGFKSRYKFKPFKLLNQISEKDTICVYNKIALSMYISRLLCICMYSHFYSIGYKNKLRLETRGEIIFNIFKFMFMFMLYSYVMSIGLVSSPLVANI